MTVSQYVHKGISPRPEELSSLAAVCSAVLHALLRLQSIRPTVAVATWLKQLDYFCASVEAGKVLAPTELAEWGIADLIDAASDTVQ